MVWEMTKTQSRFPQQISFPTSQITMRMTFLYIWPRLFAKIYDLDLNKSKSGLKNKKMYFLFFFENKKKIMTSRFPLVDIRTNQNELIWFIMKKSFRNWFPKLYFNFFRNQNFSFYCFQSRKEQNRWPRLSAIIYYLNLNNSILSLKYIIWIFLKK